MPRKPINTDRLADIEATIADLELERDGIKAERRALIRAAHTDDEHDAAIDHQRDRLDAIHLALVGAFGLYAERLVVLGGPAAREVLAERDEIRRRRQLRATNPRAFYAEQKRRAMAGFNQ